MPQDGQAAFDEIDSILSAAWAEHSPKEAPVDTSPLPSDGSLAPFGQNQSSEEDPPGTEESEETWFCPDCGRRNTGTICVECGYEKPST